MFTNKMLYNIAGISARTFYRRLADLRAKGLVDFKKTHYIDESEAQKVAEYVGFIEKFKNHLLKQKL